MDKRAILTKLNYMRMDLEKLVEEDPATWEDKKVQSRVGWLVEKIEDIEHDIKYYSKKSKQGKIYKQSDGRFAIDEDNYFTCGYPLEMFVYDSFECEKVWCEGRIEGRFENRESIYYFLNKDGDNKDLEEGDLVRIRE